MADDGMTYEEQLAYNVWLFSGPEGDLDTSDEDWLSNLQERVWVGGFRAGRRVPANPETNREVLMDAIAAIDREIEKLKSTWGLL